MNKPSMVVEIVVGGLQTLVWIILLVLNFLGIPEAINLNITDWLGLSILLLSLAYTFGVIFDKLWNSLGKRFDLKIRKNAVLFDEKELNKRRAYIFINSDAAGQFLDYIRSRMRIARATYFNTLLIWFNLIYFIPNRLTGADERYVLIFAISFCGLICVVAGFSWMKLIKTYYKQLSYFYDTLTENN